MDNSINISDYKSKQREITEGDLYSIFMGLVKLVKRKITSDLEKEYTALKDSYEQKIKELKEDAENKERMINLLVERNRIIKNRKDKQRQISRTNQLRIMVTKLAKYKVGNKEAIN